MGFLSLQSIIPPGTIFPYGGSSAPDGWVLCNGAAVSRTSDTYKALFAAIGTAYGVGDNSTTFNLPNTQGYFLRGAGTTGIYSSTRGTLQLDQFQGHKHSYSYSLGNHGGGSGFQDDILNTIPPATGTRLDRVGNPIDDGTNGLLRTGNETRPANVGVNYIIKL